MPPLRVPRRPLPPAGRGAVMPERPAHRGQVDRQPSSRCFGLCGVQPGDACAVLSETQSRAALVAAAPNWRWRSLGARWFHVVAAHAAADGAGAGALDRGVGRASAGSTPVVRRAGRAAASSSIAPSKACSTRPSCRRSSPAARACWWSATSTPRSSSAALPRAEDEAPVRDAMRRLKARRDACT
ncbi:MAG: hypothetical protein MZW92_54930 [Comamonadaceae bacterium]|nr:hypothetical protein [Comamonadaceae bacterium]